MEKPAVAFTSVLAAEGPDSYRNAWKIYNSFPVLSQGCYEYGNLVYCVAVIPSRDLSSLQIPKLRGKAMLTCVRLLREHFPRLPMKIQVRCRILENRFDVEHGVLRYVVVYSRDDLDRIME